MRNGVVAALALVLCSCHKGQPTGEPQFGKPVTTTPESPVPCPQPSDTPRVAIGDSLNDAHQRILTSGGAVVSGVGFLYFGPGRMLWYTLKDGTCLHVRVEAADGAPETVRGLTLGEPGRGYGDKLKWLNQRQCEVTTVELR